jgi:hypothetical protein
MIHLPEPSSSKTGEAWVRNMAAEFYLSLDTVMNYEIVFISQNTHRILDGVTGSDNINDIPACSCHPVDLNQFGRTCS